MTAMVEIVSYPAGAVPPDLTRDLMALMRAEAPDAFTGERARRTTLHDPHLDPICFFGRHDGRLVSYAAVLRHVVAHAGEAYRACGLSWVHTSMPSRGRGFGRLVVDAATAFMVTGGTDLILFTCDPPLRRFYERSGYRCMEGSSLVGGTRARPFPSDALGKVTMMRFVSEKARRHRASFEGVPIWLELREGDLW